MRVSTTSLSAPQSAPVSFAQVVLELLVPPAASIVTKASMASLVAVLALLALLVRRVLTAFFPPNVPVP
jgi:hypothetical protein